MMKHYHVKAPCGAIVEGRLENDAALEAYVMKLTEDHKPGGPGCHACQPEKWTVQRTE
jgi:hypothetical protein